MSSTNVGFALAAIALLAVGGLFSWRRGIAYQQSVSKMLTGRSAEPGSFGYKILQVGRWVGAIVSIGMIILIVCHLIGIFPAHSD